jgi:uncharacterized protein YxeA
MQLVWSIFIKTYVMEPSWIIIAVVAIPIIALVVYLIRRNEKDRTEVTEYFIKEASDYKDDDDGELNDKT